MGKQESIKDKIARLQKELLELQEEAELNLELNSNLDTTEVMDRANAGKVLKQVESLQESMLGITSSDEFQDTITGQEMLKRIKEGDKELSVKHAMAKSLSTSIENMVDTSLKQVAPSGEKVEYEINVDIGPKEDSEEVNIDNLITLSEVE